MPIGCGDAPVFPGDVILGDSDGVIVIPAHLADEIANEAVEMTAFEDFVTEQVQEGKIDPRTLSGHGRTDVGRFRRVAEREGAVISFFAAPRPGHETYPSASARPTAHSANA